MWSGGRASRIQHDERTVGAEDPETSKDEELLLKQELNPETWMKVRLF